MTTSIRNQFLMMLAMISLIACGFQLRGGIEANFDSISINGGSEEFVVLQFYPPEERLSLRF